MHGQGPGHISVTVGPPAWPLTLLPQWVLLKAQNMHSVCLGPCCVPLPMAAPGGHPVNTCCLGGATCRPLSVHGSVSPLASSSYGAQTVPTDIWSLHLLYQHVLCFKFVEKMSLLKNVLREPPTPPPDLAAAFLPSGLQVLLPANTPAVPSAQKACLGSLPPSAIL